MMFLHKKNGRIVEFDTEKICLAIQKAMEATHKEECFHRREEEEIANYKVFLRIMAELDWPTFLEYDPDFHAEVIACVERGDPEGIVEAIYAQFDDLFLKEFVRRIDNSKVIQPDRAPVLKEAIMLYQYEYYYGAIAILVTQLAGIIADIENYMEHTGKPYGESSVRLIDTRYKVSSNNEKGKVIKNLLEAKATDGVASEYDYMIGYLRMKVFAGSLSESELSRHANRHAICHGEQCNYGTKEHALKMILCVDALIHVAEVISKRTRWLN